MPEALVPRTGNHRKQSTRSEERRCNWATRLLGQDYDSSDGRGSCERVRKVVRAHLFLVVFGIDEEILLNSGRISQMRWPIMLQMVEMSKLSLRVSDSFINLGDCTQKACCFFTDDVEESSPMKEVKKYSGPVPLYAIYLVHTGGRVGLMGWLEAETEGFKMLQSRMKEKMQTTSMSY
nr:hypothetical protein [Tanacetum cinerariifolium]